MLNTSYISVSSTLGEVLDQAEQIGCGSISASIM